MILPLHRSQGIQHLSIQNITHMEPQLINAYRKSEHNQWILSDYTSMQLKKDIKERIKSHILNIEILHESWEVKQPNYITETLSLHKPKQCSVIKFPNPHSIQVSSIYRDTSLTTLSFLLQHEGSSNTTTNYPYLLFN